MVTEGKQSSGIWGREGEVDARHRSTNPHLRRYFGAARCEVTPPAHSLPRAQVRAIPKGAAQHSQKIWLLHPKELKVILYSTQAVPMQHLETRTTLFLSPCGNNRSQRSSSVCQPCPHSLSVLSHRPPSLEQNHQRLENSKVCIPQTPALNSFKTLNCSFNSGCKNLRNKLQD